MRWGLLVVGLMAGAAWGDGCFVRRETPAAVAPTTGTVAEDEQRVRLYWADGREKMTVSPSYVGPPTDLAWILPVPNRPRADDIQTGSEALLKSAFDDTQVARKRELPPLKPVELGPTAFLAAPDEMFMVFATFGRKTRDVYSTVSAGMSTSSDGDEEQAAPPKVRMLDQVHRERYEVTVLDAGDAGDLTRWLQGSGYHVPDGLAAAAEPYVAGGWCFLATRILVDRQFYEGPLPPLDVTFRCERPIFPLTISQVSAPPRIVLRLALVAPAPMRCTTMAQIDAPATSPGLLDAWRRGQEEANGGQSLICEARRLKGNAWTTRYWALLDRAAFTDLRFAPDARAGALQVTESCVRRPPQRLVAIVLRPCWPLLVWLLATVLVVAYRTKLSLLAAVGRAVDEMAVYWLCGLLAAVAAAVLFVVSSFLPVVMLLVGMLRLHGRAHRRLARALLWATPLAGLIAALGAQAAINVLNVDGETGVALGVCFSVGVGLYLCALTQPPCDGDEAEHGRDMNAGLLGFTLALFCAGCQLLVAARIDNVYVVDQSVYVERQADLTRAVDAFRRDTRVLPAKLADLAATKAPVAGVDAAGNATPLQGGWHGPYLPQLPIDPLTRRRDTWVYEPTGDNVVDAHW